MKGLYAILDPAHCAGRDPLWMAEQILSGGCAALQLRTKGLSDAAHLALAQAVSARCRAAGIPFWVNDRVDLALLVDAAGAHLGQNDLPLSAARRLFPTGKLGLSTHDLAQARNAVELGADVLGFGPVFPTSSKERPSPCVGLDGLREACRTVSCPVIAIGGITLAHAAAIRAAGASYGAAIGAICLAEDPRTAARALHEALIAG